MNILITAHEVAPFYKWGGLGDFTGSLPKALKKIGLDARVVIPFYQIIREEFNKNKFGVKEEKIGEFSIHFGQGREQISIYKSYFPNTHIPVYFLSNKPFLSYSGPRGRNKKVDQFAFFDLAVSHFIPWLATNESWKPQVIHCNDWHTALVPLIVQKKVKINIPTLLTIHNLNHQGRGSLKVLDLLDIKDEEVKTLRRGTPVTDINVLGEGIMHATRVSTVSPTYAKEIFENYNSNPIRYFLDERKKALRQDGYRTVTRQAQGSKQGKKDEVIGILNGIDYEVWNPKVDKFIFHQYDEGSFEDGKKNNKEDLLKSLSLEDRPTFCFVGRMARQKGIDLLIRAVKKIGNFDFNLIILGSGRPSIEKSVVGFASHYPAKVSAQIVYSEELAHRLYAGCDFIVIPSYYEPCGLIQMIAMKYATLPVASKTGGLKDSISNGKNGILFEKNSVSSLAYAIKETLSIYKNKKRFKNMIMNAIKTDFSWDKSAILYKKLYQDIIVSNGVSA